MSEICATRGDGIVFSEPLYARGAFPEGTEWSRQLRVCSPCVGLDAPRRAGLEIGVTWIGTDVCDLRRDVRVALERLPGTDGNMMLGEIAGDVSLRDTSSMQDAEALVSGPPCPPYSSIGSLGLGQDARSCILDIVGRWALVLAQRGCLLFFVLENVEGLFKRQAGQEASYGTLLVDWMSTSLPKGWKVKVMRANTRDCGVPQCRPRVFIIGVSPAMLRTPLQKRLWDRPLRQCRPVSLREVLAPCDKPEDYESLTLNQKLNVAARLDEWEAIRKTRTPHGELGVVDIARDASKVGFDSAFGFDECHTFRTNNSHLWVVPAIHLRATYGAHGRFLTWQEKARLSGIAPRSLEGMSVAGIQSALGNTIPVPLIGSVLAPLLQAWREVYRSELLGNDSSPADGVE